MIQQRRLVLAAIIGLALIVAAGASDANTIVLTTLPFTLPEEICV